jgi:hypothetical protein
MVSDPESVECFRYEENRLIHYEWNPLGSGEISQKT